jgi:asparagine synthase (glutamine-hydrolysing)
MNSIFGVSGQVLDSTLHQMGRRLIHRGGASKAHRLAHEAPVAFGVTGSENHLFSKNNFTIVADADIYNKEELHQFLVRKGISVRPESEAELLLALFQVDAVEGLEKINGDYAFAIWDGDNQLLTLVRDYCGCRPLFYTALPEDKGIAFASEYKALLTLPEISPEPDRDMLQCLQYHKKLPVGQTLFKGIRAVGPGSITMFSAAGQRVDHRKMTRIQPLTVLSNEAEAVAEVRNALAGAIKCRISHPERIGIALSGGIDSIGIAFICRHLFPDSEIHTFTAGSDPQDEELVVAERVSRSIQSIHHAVITLPDLMKDHLEKLVWHIEEPYARSESLQLFKIGEAAAPHVTSLLCGMEADALFAGMPRHKILWLMSKWPFLKGILGEIYDLTQSGLQPTSLGGKILLKSYLRHKTAPIPKVVGSSYRPNKTVFPTNNNQLVNTFLASIFQAGAFQDGQKLEKPFAAWGVRYQSPFLDPNMIRVAFGISDELKFKNGKNKYILRKALQAFVPEEFTYIPKKPQRMKYDLAFSKTLDEVAMHYLGSGRQRIFDTKDISALKKMKRKGAYPAESAMRLWTAVLTQIWYEQFTRL